MLEGTALAMSLLGIVRENQLLSLNFIDIKIWESSGVQVCT